VTTDNTCDQCGHPFDIHRICGPTDESIGAPIEGWTQCPMPGCTCYSTWSLAPEVLAALDSDDVRAWLAAFSPVSDN
jgi:hypothetical protein